MTKYLIILGAIVLASCSKKTDANSLQSEVSEKLDYDTIAIDSFAPGATPANMAPKIIIVKDSAKEAKKKELETQIKELEKKKKDDEKKKADEKAKQQAAQPVSPPSPTAN